jgi:CrcB protein
MILYLWVFLGAGIGGVARFALSGLVATHFGDSFPWGTLVINVTGSFAIGFFATLTAPGGRVFAGATARQFVMTGILGGYTTYSSFSLQTLSLARAGQWLHAGANASGMFLFCFVAVWLGSMCALWLNNMKGN